MMMPPPAIPTCPTCRQPLAYNTEFDVWLCINPLCDDQQEDVFSLAAYEADQRAKAEYLDSLDNARTDDDDCEDE